MSWTRHQAWTAIAASVVALLAASAPASATAPEIQSIEGTLQFCEPACDLGTLRAAGPVAGTATVAILSDHPNRRFSVTRLRLLLTIDGTDTVTLAVTLHSTGSDVTDPCRVTFDEDGHWRIASGTGRYADLQGEGLVHNHGLAVDHDPSCGGSPYSTVDWHLVGRARHQTR